MGLIGTLAEGVFGKGWSPQNVNSDLSGSKTVMVRGTRRISLPLFEVFAPNTNRSAKIKISQVWPAFEKLFYMNGYVVTSQSDSVLVYDEVGDYTLINLQKAELDFGKSATVSFGQILSLLLEQGSGEEGPLLTNGWSNGFRAVNDYDELCTIVVYADSEGWCIGVEADDKGGLKKGRFFYAQ